MDYLGKMPNNEAERDVLTVRIVDIKLLVKLHYMCNLSISPAFLTLDIKPPPFSMLFQLSYYHE